MHVVFLGISHCSFHSFVDIHDIDDIFLGMELDGTYDQNCLSLSIPDVTFKTFTLKLIVQLFELPNLEPRFAIRMKESDFRDRVVDVMEEPLFVGTDWEGLERRKAFGQVM